MRAGFFRQHGGSEVMEIGEAPDPVLAHGTVIVRVRAVALNHLDLWVRRGIPGLSLDLPHIGGSDAAGEIAEVGPGVTGWAAGDRVVINPSLWCGECDFCSAGEESMCRRFMVLGEHVTGAAAELVRVPAQNLWSIPDMLSFAEAAATPLVFQTAWRALMSRAGLREGDVLLVTGASGGVSTAALQIGKWCGATVLAVTSGADNVARVAELGADHVIDRAADDLRTAVRAATQGGKVDVILDSVGEGMWPDLIRCLDNNGRIVSYGATTGSAVRIDLQHVFWKQLQVIGTTMGSRAEFESVMKLVGDGTFRAVVHDTWALDRIAAAHAELEEGRVFGKLVLVP
ncbi:MAG: zinc-binding dehydrogenase [Gemmatimonadota bacterium]